MLLMSGAAVITDYPRRAPSNAALALKIKSAGDGMTVMAGIRDDGGTVVAHCADDMQMMTCLSSAVLLRRNAWLLKRSQHISVQK